MIWWRESKLDRPHDDSVGLPDVLLKPRIRSRALAYTYDRHHGHPELNEKGRSCTESCLASDCISDRSSLTREKADETRDSPGAIAPVGGTILVERAYTGRPSSLVNENCCTGLKFRSNVLAWFMLREYVASTVAENRLSRIIPDHWRFERSARGDVQSVRNSVQFCGA